MSETANGTARGTANARQDYKAPREGIDLTRASVYPDMSARHADHAVDALVRATTSTDSRQQEQSIAIAQVYATLSLRDKVDELVATMKRQQRS